MAKRKPDKYHYHEALDRIYIICNQIEELLICHPVVTKHKKLKKRVKKVQRLLFEAYQITGALNI